MVRRRVFQSDFTRKDYRQKKKKIGGCIRPSQLQISSCPIGIVSSICGIQFDCLTVVTNSLIPLFSFVCCITLQKLKEIKKNKMTIIMKTEDIHHIKQKNTQNKSSNNIILHRWKRKKEGKKNYPLKQKVGTNDILRSREDHRKKKFRYTSELQNV